MSDDRKTGREALEEISARLGDLFGAVKDALGGAAERARTDADADDADAPSGARAFTVDTPQGPMKGVAEWSVRTSSVADAIAARGGAERPTPRPKPRPKQTADAEPPRDCRAEAFDEPDGWTLTAELPGVAAEEIVVRLDGALSFETTGARRFAHRVEPSAEVVAGPLQAQLTNGILEIRLPKAG